MYIHIYTYVCNHMNIYVYVYIYVYVNICVTCWFYTCRQNSCMRVARLTYLCDMAHSCVRHNSLVRVPWLIFQIIFIRLPLLSLCTCAMTRSYECHNSFTCALWLLHTYAYAMTHAYTWLSVRCLAAVTGHRWHPSYMRGACIPHFYYMTCAWHLLRETCVNGIRSRRRSDSYI